MILKYWFPVFIINILVLIYNIKGEFLKFNERIQATQESSAQCVLQVARLYFHYGSITCIMESGLPRVANLNTAKSSYRLILEKFMEESQWPVMIKQANIPNIEFELSYEKVHNYILFMRTKADLSIILIELKNSVSWNPHAFVYVIIDADIGLEWEALVITFFQTLWDHFLINVTIMIPDTINFVQQIITWFPFDAGNCGTTQKQLSYVKCAICQNKRIVPDNANIFPNKIPLDLNRCIINITTTIWPPFITYSNKISSKFHDGDYLNLTQGIEINILNTIANKINIALNYRVQIFNQWGEIYWSNNDPKNLIHLKDGYGMLGDLIKRKADIAIGTLTPRQDLHQLFDFTVQYMQDEIKWIVPISDPIPQWHSLILIFQYTLWLASLFAYLAVVIIVYMVGKIEHIWLTNGMNNIGFINNQKYYKFIDISFTIWNMMIGCAPSLPPTTYRMRIILCLWAALCLNWYTAYTTSLISMLTTPIHIEQITTIEDILNHDMKFGMQTPTVQYFQSHQYSMNDQISLMIMSKYQLCDNANDCLKRIVDHRDYAFAVSRMYFDKIEKNYRSIEGKPLLRLLKKNIVSPPIEILLTKGHPLLSRIDDIILRLLNAGLINFWTDQNKNQVTDYISNLPALSLYHLMGAFIAFGLGILLSSIIFFIEFMNYKNYHNKFV